MASGQEMSRQAECISNMHTHHATLNFLALDGTPTLGSS
ncbi:hypothetical protein CBM2634_B160129 [Cupriavidus taiwanensis]|uniref:Uncharacterized protein n=1 Tax=Cupriavidus taiwanensis TaxID=164546 RepID=A0A375J8G7_9BURK|nr:hypothetical protein CBM2634_B160129 [Cupriavidus taiwanensis]